VPVALPLISAEMRYYNCAASRPRSGIELASGAAEPQLLDLRDAICFRSVRAVSSLYSRSRLQFLPSSSCKLVAGTISPKGWCALFALKPT
jgi:hypothetical protein